MQVHSCSFNTSNYWNWRGMCWSRPVVEMLCLKLHSQFSSHLYETCFTWSPMKSKCVWHVICEARPGVTELLPLFTKFWYIVYPYIKSLCLKLIPQYSSLLIIFDGWQLQVPLIGSLSGPTILILSSNSKLFLKGCV